MEKFRVRLSLRYKLLFLLVSLPLISLSLYLVMATDLFQKDKVAYVFDSSATVSRSLATQTRMELQNAYTVLRAIAETADPGSQSFLATGRELFAKDPRLHAIVLLRRQESGQYFRLAEMAKENAGPQTFLKDDKRLTAIREITAEGTAFLTEYADMPGAIAVAYRLGEREDPRHMVMIGLYQADDLTGAFEASGLYASFVATRTGRLAMGTDKVVDSDLPILAPILRAKAAEGTAELRLSDANDYLISYSSVGVGDLLVMSRVDKTKALKAVEVLVAKSLLFFIALLASTLLISVFASNQLTSTLRELFEATKKIAQGDFNVSVKAASKDEVGGLAQSFNWMAAEVSRLMSETAEKARMESELSTVRTVQETLFPPPQTQFGPLRIVGHFEPASECGGDWWNYSRVGNKIYVWIGDATGHGAPAALITSAARSAAAVIESLPDMDPGRALTILNRAIHQTSKGQIMMTFFIACIDTDQKRMTYACASHDPPFLMRSKSDKITKKDIIPLNDVNGPRLGDQKDHQYKDFTVEFDPGDQIFFYTDGILDIEDPKGAKLGERAFIRNLLESANSGETLDSKLELLRGKLDGFRSGAQLIDDVTMVMCEFEKRAA